MDKILDSAVDILNTSFYICIFILFYLSLKKCFLKEGKSKVTLFFLTLFTNPFILLTGMTLLMTIIDAIKYILSLEDPSVVINDNSKVLEYVYSAVPTSTLIGGILSVALMIVFSHLVAKWLDAYNKSLVTFIYLMFAVLFVLSTGGVKSRDDSMKLYSKSANLIILLVIFAALWLLYLFVVGSLSRLTDRKQNVNWKIFVVPPAIFLPLYCILSFTTSIFGSTETTVVAQILAIVIVYLFIWAFYVIIKNIIFTNEAINAKNDAIAARDEVKTLSVEVMEALARTIDAKDKYTKGHSTRVAKYSRMIAQKMGLSADFCENIYYMGLLHDIGKIGVPNEIINKPTKLTDSEYDIIKTHPEIGYNILSEIHSRPDLAQGAHWHHERYDGRGYPDKKAGEDIPLESRIIAVADSYDAMTSNRSYRSYLPQSKVRSEIEANIGTQFDPEAAKHMIMIIDEDKDYILHE